MTMTTRNLLLVLSLSACGVDPAPTTAPRDMLEADIRVTGAQVLDEPAGDCPSIRIDDDAVNPLELRFEVPDGAPLDPGAYRVLGAGGEVLQGWTTLTPDDDGAYTVALYHDDLPALDQPGERRLDVRFPDTHGIEKIASVCWDRMALPL